MQEFWESSDARMVRQALENITTRTEGPQPGVAYVNVKTLIMLRHPDGNIFVYQGDSRDVSTSDLIILHQGGVNPFKTRKHERTEWEEKLEYGPTDMYIANVINTINKMLASHKIQVKHVAPPYKPNTLKCPANLPAEYKYSITLDLMNMQKVPFYNRLVKK